MTNKMNGNKIKQEMAKYKPDELELYLAEAGWQEWMESYTETKDGGIISETENKEIVQIQKKLWYEVHPEAEE